MTTLVQKRIEKEAQERARYPTKTVYLAGPITGLTYGDARHGWRKEFALMLPPHIIPLSPMRGKDMLMGVDEMQGGPDMYPTNALCAPSGIIARDRNDIRNCDIMVACFLDAKYHSSIGTSVEFGWADAYRKPVVMVIEDDDNVHLHAFLTEIAGYRVNNLEEAAQIVACLLTPGV